MQKYLTLPGGVTVTLKPQSTSAGAATYSLSNIHGDTMATVDADGLATIQAPTGPFGEILPSSGVPKNTVDGASFAYVGSAKKTTDTDFEIAPIQMGARVYVAEMGRFLSVDPVDGGTDNSYAYVNDPVNEYDLNGQWGFSSVFTAIKNKVKSVVKAVKKVVAAKVKQVVKTATAIVQKAVYTYTNIVKPAVKAAAVTIVNKARQAPAAVKKVANKAIKTNTAKKIVKYGDAANVVVAAATVGVCIAILAGCAVATGVSIATGALVAATQSYSKHGSIKRATLQGAGSIGNDLLTGLAIVRISKAAFGASRVGQAAVEMHGMPLAFSSGFGVEALVNGFCDATGGRC